MPSRYNDLGSIVITAAANSKRQRWSCDVDLSLINEVFPSLCELVIGDITRNVAGQQVASRSLLWPIFVCFSSTGPNPTNQLHSLTELRSNFFTKHRFRMLFLSGNSVSDYKEPSRTLLQRNTHRNKWTVKRQQENCSVSRMMDNTREFHVHIKFSSDCG